MNKKVLRKKFLDERNSIIYSDRVLMQSSIESSLFALDEYKNCNRLFIYVSTRGEVDTKKIIINALNGGKDVAVPKCTDENGNMQFYFINSLDDLSVGMFGILEPNANICRKADDYSNGVCIVPGVCFDEVGNRVGYGKGYYDRFLQSFGGISIGLCFSRCICENISVSEFDEKVDIIISDAGSIGGSK